MPEEAASPGKRYSPGKILFRYRGALGVGVAAFLLFFPYGRSPPRAWQFLSGFTLIAAGVALRLWCILQIGGSARKTSRLKAVRIIAWGPYAMVRNPIYIANTTIFAGFTVFSGLIWVLPIVLIALWLWYDAVVRREEKFLEESFPENYAAYKAITGRWLPRFRFQVRPAEIPPYPFLRALKRERGLLLTVSTGMLALILSRAIWWR